MLLAPVYTIKKRGLAVKIAGRGRIAAFIFRCLFCFPARPDAILCPSVEEISQKPWPAN